MTDAPPTGSPRRSFLRDAGLTGAGVAAATVLGAQPAAAHRRPRRGADRPRRGGYLWLAGDHHLHSQYSNDAMFRVDDQVQRAIDHGLDWMVITDHGNTAFSSYSVPMLAADVRAARKAKLDDILVFLGMEWNMPGAEHATLMLAPGKRRGRVPATSSSARYDARVTNTRDGTPANEALALEAIKFLRPRRTGRTDSRTRWSWRTTRPGSASTRRTNSAPGATPPRSIVLGMEGAPGHQAAGLPAPGMARGRGLYDGAPSTYSFPGLPAGGLPHARRIRLDDRDRRRRVGQHARRRQTVLDHGQLRRPSGLRRLGSEPGGCPRPEVLRHHAVRREPAARS